MAKRVKSLRSQRDKREGYEKVLIVCEGEKTEPNYFNGIKNELKLNGANVKVHGRGASPLQIVNHAKKLYKQEKINGAAFDKVFCVFDRNGHGDYEKALDAAGQFNLIISVPCFEYWLLLHYRYTAKSYGGADEVIADLKREIPDYEKGKGDIFSTVKDKTGKAKENAGKALKEAQSTGADGPVTRVHELVDFLYNIKNS